MAPPQLTLVFTMRGVMSKQSLDLGAIKSGPYRSCAPLTGGFLKGVKGSRGEGLDIELLPGGSDWILFDPTTNIAHLDVRTHGTNAKGDSVYIHYTGYLRVDEAGSKFMKWAPDAKTTNYGDHHWWTNPIFETNSQKFKWIETSPFTARGHWVNDDGVQSVEYEIYAVDH